MIWCLIVLTILASVVVNPNKFFKMLAFGPLRPLRPRDIENRWGLLFYRVTAGVIFGVVFALLVKLVITS